MWDLNEHDGIDGVGSSSAKAGPYTPEVHIVRMAYMARWRLRSYDPSMGLSVDEDGTTAGPGWTNSPICEFTLPVLPSPKESLERPKTTEALSA